jgi:hypothetical protein
MAQQTSNDSLENLKNAHWQAAGKRLHAFLLNQACFLDVEPVDHGKYRWSVEYEEKREFFAPSDNAADLVIWLYGHLRNTDMPTKSAWAAIRHAGALDLFGQGRELLIFAVSLSHSFIMRDGEVDMLGLKVFTSQNPGLHHEKAAAAYLSAHALGILEMTRFFHTHYYRLAWTCNAKSDSRCWEFSISNFTKSEILNKDMDPLDTRPTAVLFFTEELSENRIPMTVLELMTKMQHLFQADKKDMTDEDLRNMASIKAIHLDPLLAAIH